TAGDAAPEGDPSGVAAHDFENHDALVAFRSGVQAVEPIDDGGDRGVEAEGHGRGAEVVVDGFRHADDGPALTEKLEAGGERAVSTDDDERADFQLVHRALRLRHDL